MNVCHVCTPPVQVRQVIIDAQQPLLLVDAEPAVDGPIAAHQIGDQWFGYQLHAGWQPRPTYTRHRIHHHTDRTDQP